MKGLKIVPLKFKFLGETRENEDNITIANKSVQKKISIKKSQSYEERTEWYSIILAYIMMFFCGIHISVYFTSMWPYLSTLNPNVNIDVLGWIVASFSIGQTFGSPVFGFWSQKSSSTKNVVCCGIFFTIIGNIIYAALPNFSSNCVVEWMIVSRLIVGFGSGCLGTLRAYVATSCLSKDRRRVVALGIASFVLGLSSGPAVQAAFTPFGEYTGKFFLGITINMFTAPPIAMIILSIGAIIFFHFTFVENYVGVIKKNNLEDGETPIKIPKFDKIAVCVCIYLWFAQQSVSTNIEVIAAPLTISMYNWNDEEAILYNGMFFSLACLLSVSNYLIQAFTPVGKIDKRKLIVFGLTNFIIFHVINYPYGFYGGHLDPIKLAPNSTIEDTAYSGGCSSKYDWCNTMTRVPLILYAITMILCFGFAYPYTAAPNGTMFAEVLGPRKQGGMQGIFESFGALARCIGPVVATKLFEISGSRLCMLTQGISLSIGIVLILIFRKRLVPLVVPGVVEK
ncbi:Major facilitator superfamily and Major facilitator superfamily domain, general substrate transporter-containing protein [Strongyloides ratti]|uniref:Major facilitator superfamily and Major facilitator superfamily domain, general substrate transporter-containing protein n=1 Tax=Strongyloides ratti TaxID=34506 RepID=A0A090LSP3_STRRB|nr:Major facilitator superfamily and Major facilitator superfamily domain, general substrate transporter-containing protein [Strongyloides ratti]CEF71202.1 Major facilitator superfamily and Major facilitator superfamily domain, general substrate transporter-containing protein [Strongyloides ratti]